MKAIKKKKKAETDRELREMVSEICYCDKCEQKKDCRYKGKYIRLPGELFKGGLGLCPKISNERF